MYENICDRTFNICYMSKSIGLLSAIPIIPKIKALETRELEKKHVENIRVFFLKYNFLHQNNLLTHLLCHLTYVTAFNKCSGPRVQLANLLFLVY